MKSIFFIEENDIIEINNNYRSFDKLKCSHNDDHLMKVRRRILLVDDEPYNLLGL